MHRDEIIRREINSLKYEILLIIYESIKAHR